MSFENTEIHFSADNKDLLNCPICYCAFGLEQNQPISTNCGHTICSACFPKIEKCPLCKGRFDKTQRYQKSILLSSLIANSAKTQICKEHSNICQGICRQDKVFVCFDCVTKSHKDHEFITLNDLQAKTKKLTTETKKAREKEKKHIELEKSIEEDNKSQKRKFDEMIDQEIFQLSMLRKKLYKETDIQAISDKDRQEHRLLSENLSKNCQRTEKMLGDWDKNQEAGLAIQIMETSSENAPEVQDYENEIRMFKADFAARQEKLLDETRKKMRAISYSSAKVKNLFAFDKQTGPALGLSQLEFDYLVDVLRHCCFVVSLENGVLELKVDETRTFPYKFDSSYFTCSLSKISLNCPDLIPTQSFQIICQILQSVMDLKDLSLKFERLGILEICALLDLLPNLKYLEELSVEMDLEKISRFGVGCFMKDLINGKSFSTLNIQYIEPKTIISAQSTSVRSESLEEINLSLEGLPGGICEILRSVSAPGVRSLKTLRLTLGKTEYRPEALETISKTLNLLKDLKELIFIWEDLNDTTEMDFSVLLMGLAQQKKLGIFVNKVSLSANKSPTNFLVGCHLQDLEEFAFKVKCGSVVNFAENFESLIGFLANSKALKKLCLQFDGIELTLKPTKELFNQIAKLDTLVSVEIEFLNFNSCFKSNGERNLKAILDELPAHVTKKCTFSRAKSQ